MTTARAALLLLAALATAVGTAPAQDGGAPGTLTAGGVDPASTDARPGFLLPARDTDDADLRASDRAELGRFLFYDPQLSRNRQRSCASCHRQEHAFADDRRKSRGFAGRDTVRNTMGLANLRFRQGGLFWDGRAVSVEQAVLQPIENPIEMGLDLGVLVQRLRAARGYPELFARAFGSPEVSPPRIAEALAEFVRAIVSMHSKYDEGLAATRDVTKDFTNFTPAENRGKALFFGAAACADCHAPAPAASWGGSRAFDPSMIDGLAGAGNGIDKGARDDDPGRAGATGRAEDHGIFRAPSLRNIELTAPYMHDGRFATLAEVVKHYARHPVLRAEPAGRSSAARPEPVPQFASITGGSGVLETSEQRADLVAFLKTLTDRRLVFDPRLADPFATDPFAPSR